MFFRNAVLISLFVAVCCSGAWAQDISVQLDGRTLQFDQPPAMVGGRLLVPLRGIFEALQADVVYDAPTRSIQATKGSKVVQLQLGSRTAIIDGRTLFLDVPADTIGGRTMVPLRFVSESLGAEVKWDGPTKTVKLSSAGGDTTTPPPNNNPNPPDTSGQAPRVDQVIHNATRPLKAGDAVDVIVYGESGGQASFEILGATRTIALPEVSPGKYQTRWTIPNGLAVTDGVLLAHLEKNGRESAVEAKRAITVTAGGGGQTNPTTWNIEPNNNSVVSSARPPVTLYFPQSVQNNSVRFYVDGVDFSNQVQVQGNRMTWTPGYDLATGQHQAEVQGVGVNGQSLTQQWSFRIDPNAGNFDATELLPAQGSTAGPRDQIRVVLNQNVRSLALYVDNKPINNLPGLQRFSNGISWTPNYDLTAGTHRARIQAVAQDGRVLNRDWTWTVAVTSITNFSVSPNPVGSGQQLTVRLNGPSGATGYFTVGQASNLQLRETSSGQYVGTYDIPQIQGTLGVQAFLRQADGRVLASPTQQVQIQAGSTLSVTNLRDGMTISPVFNVQGQGQPGRTVSVLVEYSSDNILGALTGQMRTIRNQTVVGQNGFFDVPIDASSIRSGQQFRLTVSDGQSRQVQMVMTRQ